MGNPSGIVFKNNVGKNPGVMRNYMYGVCVAVYGARDVSVIGTKCYDIRSWKRTCKNCNSCLAYVHDNWFGAVYPDGNTISMYNNEYLYTDGTRIPITDRPLVRSDVGSRAHILLSLPLSSQVLGVADEVYAASAQKVELLNAEVDEAVRHQSDESRWCLITLLGCGMLACGLFFLWGVHRSTSQKRGFTFSKDASEIESEFSSDEEATVE